MTVSTVHRKVIILPDGTQIRRIVQKITYKGSYYNPTDIRGKVNYYGSLIDVVPLHKSEKYPDITEWKVVENGTGKGHLQD